MTPKDFQRLEKKTPLDFETMKMRKYISFGDLPVTSIVCEFEFPKRSYAVTTTVVWQQVAAYWNFVDDFVPLMNVDEERIPVGDDDTS